MPHIPSLARRARGVEEMDDLTLDGAELRRALHELRYVNRFLGGHRALRRVIGPYLHASSGRTVRILDLGSGLADVAIELFKWAARESVCLYFVALDGNGAVVEHARAFVDARLPPGPRSKVQFVHADARRAPFDDGAFDVVIASHFLHHFDDQTAAELLGEMSRMASAGIVVNDLQRHLAAYAGIHAVATLLPVSETFRHDGPLSVRRGFTPDELEVLATAAGLEGVRIRRHWAFRLTLSTLPDKLPPS